MTSNEQNAKRARRAVHDLVNTNWTEYTKMLTLTYATTNLDYDKLNKDYKTFLLNLKRKDITFPYLSITENQLKRGKKENNEGSLHLHVIIFTDTYIPFKTLKTAWGNRGSVHIEKLDTAKNKGAYVAKYITKDSVKPDKKSYRCSRDIKKPLIERDFKGREFKENSLKNSILLNTYEYTIGELVSQETGELTPDNIVKVYQYKT